jgi:putative tryptophan/tyrosine transport system substrate-binding protein
MRAPIILATCLSLMALAPAALAQGPVPGKTYRIGFSQIVDHPALNATRAGFLEGLKESGFVEGKNLIFEYQNAQGDIGNARNIAQKFVADHVDLLAPCTTPNTLATIKVARGTSIPVAFGCVTDPVKSGVLSSLDKPTGTNVTGLYGAQPVDELLDLIGQILPQVKTIGTIYNGGEANSVTANAVAKAAAQKRGWHWVEVQITSSAEVKTAAESLVGRVDAIMTPQDNTVASAYDAVVKATRDHHIPLFSLDTTAVQRGALAAYGVDQFKSGVAWAKEVAVPVLLGRNPATFVPVAYRTYDLYLNAATAKADALTLPPAVIKQAHKIYDK